MADSIHTQPPTHVRTHRSVLASAEKRLLISIAERLPRRVTPDLPSSLSLVSMVFGGLSFAAFRWTPWAAAGVVASLFANWFGDSLDGTVARVRHVERPRYGYAVWAAYSPFVAIGGRELRFFDIAGVAATIGLAVAFVASAARNTSTLYEAERLTEGRPASETVRR